ncbi:hypothetical protein OH76DRAFT_1033456 [Lentinus brumalis]|uniref:Uncharacterized protein n=1 Tax=Lentinus brumalis TaxID=2498619 RepID=A0A371CXJ9_9APHY|nr:hypothetical protein OH76DRAFT_1033456 [Polyporus brumalis]
MAVQLLAQQYHHFWQAISDIDRYRHSNYCTLPALSFLHHDLPAQPASMAHCTPLVHRHDQLASRNVHMGTVISPQQPAKNHGSGSRRNGVKLDQASPSFIQLLLRALATPKTPGAHGSSTQATDRLAPTTRRRGHIGGSRSACLEFGSATPTGSKHHSKLPDVCFSKVC